MLGSKADPMQKDVLIDFHIDFFKYNSWVSYTRDVGGGGYHPPLDILIPESLHQWLFKS